MRAMGGVRLGLLLITAVVLVSGCGEGVPSTVQTSGPAARSIAWLTWGLLAGAVAVSILVVVFLWAAGTDRWPGAPGWLAGPNEHFVIFWGVGVTGVILLAVLAATIATNVATYMPDAEPDVVIEVVGHQYWWELRYDEGETVTANEIVVPVGEPVALDLVTADVIHSVWVPELTGKMDMIPGHANRMWLQADEAGAYRGVCAEFCGLQHAQMHFLVVAMERPDFDAWLEDLRAPVAEPTTSAEQAGAEVFDSAACIQCHGLAGVRDATSAGPDLSNFASRRTIAAGMQPNTRDNLAAWILDPHASKPGVRMPPVDLDPNDLEALLDYLETLE